MSAGRWQRWLPWVALGAAIVWLLVREWHYAGWMDDDAFISFRYAQNLAEGNGLVFNPGERVEGYTNFLWVLLLAAGDVLGAAPDVAAHGWSLLATVGLWALVAWYAWRAWAPGERWWLIAI